VGGAKRPLDISSVSAVREDEAKIARPFGQGQKQLVDFRRDPNVVDAAHGARGLNT
jgi:hypothetical protein